MKKKNTFFPAWGSLIAITALILLSTYSGFGSLRNFSTQAVVNQGNLQKDLVETAENGSGKILDAIVDLNSLSEKEIRQRIESDLLRTLQGSARYLETDMNGLLDFVRLFSTTCATEKKNVEKYLTDSTSENILLIPFAKPLYYREVGLRGNRRKTCDPIRETETGSSMEVHRPSRIPDFFQLLREAMENGSNDGGAANDSFAVVHDSFSDFMILSSDNAVEETQKTDVSESASIVEEKTVEAEKTIVEPESKTGEMLSNVDSSRENPIQNPEPVTSVEPVRTIREEPSKTEKRQVSETTEKEPEAKPVKEIEERKNAETARKELETKLAEQIDKARVEFVLPQIDMEIGGKILENALEISRKQLKEEKEKRKYTERKIVELEAAIQKDVLQQKNLQTKLEQEAAQRKAAEDRLKLESEQRLAVDEAKKAAEAKLEQEAAQRKTAEDRLKLESEQRLAVDEAKKAAEAKLEQEAAQRKAAEDRLKQETEKRQAAENQALRLSEENEQHRTSSETLKTAIKEDQREFLKDWTFKTVQENEQLRSAWFCWEPNAFDFNDEKKGRFSADSRRDAKGQVVVGDVERPDSSEFYVKPMSTGRIHISEPVRRTGGDMVVTISSPIRHRNKSIGVCGIELKNDRFRDMLTRAVQEHDLLRKNGKAFLVSPEGNVMASSDSKAEAGSRYRAPVGEKTYSVSSRFDVDGRTWTLHLHVPEADLEQACQKIHEAGLETRGIAAEAGENLKTKFQEVENGFAESCETLKSNAQRKIRYIAAGLFFVGIVLVWRLAVYVRNQAADLDDRYRQVLDGVPVPLFVVDEDSNVLVRNKAAESGKINPSAEALKAFFQRNIATVRGTSDHAVYDIVSKRIRCGDRAAGAVQAFVDTTLAVRTAQKTDELRRLLAASQEKLDAILSLTGNLHDGTIQTSQRLEDILGKIDKSCRLSDQTGENASQANRFTSDAVRAASKGQTQMKEMIESMNEICDMSSRMQKVIKSIDEIAFQTNLLALNAAVEAARAGVHGKGFAVVAEEVRNLATRSAKAARETAQLIEASNTQILGGAGIANQTAEALNEITRLIEEATGLVSQIADTSTEQSGQVRDISRELSLLEQLSQQNLGAGGEATASARSVIEMFRELEAIGR